MSCTVKQYEANSKKTSMKWQTNKKPSENLIGTKWKLDLGENQCYTSEELEEYERIRNTNLLTILSDRILLTKLTDGLDSEKLKKKSDERLLSDSEMYGDYVHLQIKKDEEKIRDAPGSNELSIKLDGAWINERSKEFNGPISSSRVDFFIDPTVEFDSRYINTKVYSSKGPRKIDEPLKGIQLKMSLNFTLDNLKNLDTYWIRIFEKSSCSIDDSLYSETAIASKCIKYEAGNFNEQVKLLYNNLLMTSAISNNYLDEEFWKGDCWHRSPENLEICKKAALADATQEQKKKCLEFMNCELKPKYGLDKMLELSISANKGKNQCKAEKGSNQKLDTVCTLYDNDLLRPAMNRTIKQLNSYKPYPQHIDLYDNISEFGKECNGKTIEKIESMCRNKNIGISYRWEPSYCDPSRPEYNKDLCVAECDKDNCKSPVLAKEPDLSSYTCKLVDLDKLEQECILTQEKVIKNPSYKSLFGADFVEKNFIMVGYDKDNYPYTGCNESAIEEYLIYIRFKLMSKVRATTNKINNIIKEDAKNREEYSKKRSDALNMFNRELKSHHKSLINGKKQNLGFIKEIGRLNNTYNRMKASIKDYNERLDNSIPKKRRDYKLFIFVSFLILNLLLFAIFFRKNN
jgi:hypothetical protein